ncbi:MAG TPA: site-2 protease family protein, partial [Chthonomonadales bacterium]|nr:site-2 protease family protein [Chthonomonadales bacterium]
MAAGQIMICSACGKTNLPGGVRCIYCGVAFPEQPDFHIPEAPPTQPAAVASSSNAQKKRAGLLGSLAILLVKAKSLLVFLKFGKIITTLGSMLLFIGADTLLFGWRFGVGIAVCILIHEMGHVTVNWAKGLKQSAPMFIPFVGAVIFIKQFPDDPTIQSESGAGGPAAGMLAAVACLLIGLATHQQFWIALANVGFFINLFNMVPFPPLDGSHITSVFSPRIWDFCLVTMLLWVIKAPSGMLWMVLIVAFLFRLGLRGDRYLLARPSVRIRMAAVFLVLCLGLSYGAGYTQSARAVFAHDIARARGYRYQAPAANAAPAQRAQFSREELLLFLRIYLILLGASGMLLWMGAASCAAAGTYRGFRPAQLLLGVVMGGFCIAVLAAALAGQLPVKPAYQLLIAGLLAALAGCGRSIALAVASKRLQYRRSLSANVSSILAAAAAGALVSAYWQNSVIVLGTVAAAALVYCLLYPWSLTLVVAHVQMDMGDREKGLNLLRKALSMRPDPETAAMIWNEVARVDLSLSRGGAALVALSEHDRLAPGMEDSIAGLRLSAHALTCVEQYDEALLRCEQILSAPQTDLLSHSRLAIVR